MQDQDKAESYRKEANRYAELARSTCEPAFLSDVYRQIAVRYVLMAEDVLRWPESRRGRTGDWDGLSASLPARADHLLGQRTENL